MQLFKQIAGALVVAATAVEGAAPTAAITPANSVKCSQYASTPTIVQTSPALAMPQDLAIDGNGDVFVVDSIRKAVVRVDGQFKNSSVVLGPAILQVPVGVALSPTHADLYIGDENTSTVWHLPCQTRGNTYCKEYHKTPLNVSFDDTVHPMGLQVDADEHLYVADYRGNRVLKRNANTGEISVLLSAKNMVGDLPANPFGPYDVTVDASTHEVLVTDSNNDDIWSLKCMQPSTTGLSCEVYNPQPSKLDLTGISDISEPSGIVTNLHSTIYVTGKVDGIVAEIKGNNSVDLLSSGTPNYLQKPDAISIDSRPQSKTLYITDDPSGRNSTQGLYALPCQQHTCVALDERYIPNVYPGSCANVAVGSACTLQCVRGFYSPNATSVSCTALGWSTSGIVCLPNSDPASQTSMGPANTPGDDGVGVAVGVTLAVLVVAGVGVFLFIRYRQGKLIVKTTSEKYTTFGSTL